VCFNRGYTPPTPTPSPSPNPSISSPSPQTLPPSKLEIKISTFDGTEDAYWWIICSEKSFNGRNQRLSDTEKVLESALAMRGCALTWWISWFPTHPMPSWDSFTCALLWHCKPEWRPILPIEGEEEPTEEEPKENKEVLQRLEEEGTPFIPPIQEEQIVAEPKKLVDCSGDLQIIQAENKEKKKSEPATHHDSLSTFPFPKLLLPPTQSTNVLPTTVNNTSFQFTTPYELLSPTMRKRNTFSAHSTLEKPPPMPPEINVFTISDFPPLKPPAPKPPELSFSTLPPPPSLPQPPPKPPDRVSHSAPTLQPPLKPPDLQSSQKKDFISTTVIAATTAGTTRSTFSFPPLRRALPSSNRPFQKLSVLFEIPASFYPLPHRRF
jgi:hypothetical protein